MRKAGVLFIGALGYIGTAVISGALALKKGLSSRTGMVTDLEPFSGQGLVEPEDLSFGGWDIRASTPYESAMSFFRDNQLACSEILPHIGEELKEIGSNIYPGITTNCGRAIEVLAAKAQSTCPPLKAQVERLKEDIRDFRERNGVEDVVIVNLASTEPPLEIKDMHQTLNGLESSIEKDRREVLRASTLYAYAAVSEGCPYINFTPSNGALIPAVIELAQKKGTPVMGNDGKTGETLVKSALIPMFLYRNLEILSWEGFNILGNMDGRVLDDPENKESKIITKDQILGKALGYSPHSKVHIHYVPSLDDQKTAWNFIHFRGFLGAKMSLQFIWQGYDSLLAAPLIIDLIRLSEFSKRRGEAGVMVQLASFFKAPLHVNEYRLYEQFQMLMDYIKKARPPAVSA